ncbi:hypothetical protein ALC62_14176 [Cyphomyrmex costatus]|uniref:Uncharacterized protein n=1 Tax=Cyphomyrmex costatus TaxID=456900 RepID=A0A195C3S8_9HYME|nr:hypothetical protein ALC62_14176 [Cyphomyrmex costatus]
MGTAIGTNTDKANAHGPRAFSSQKRASQGEEDALTSVYDAAGKRKVLCSKPPSACQVIALRIDSAPRVRLMLRAFCEASTIRRRSSMIHPRSILEGKKTRSRNKADVGWQSLNFKPALLVQLLLVIAVYTVNHSSVPFTANVKNMRDFACERTLSRLPEGTIFRGRSQPLTVTSWSDSIGLRSRDHLEPGIHGSPDRFLIFIYNFTIRQFNDADQFYLVRKTAMGKEKDAYRIIHSYLLRRVVILTCLSQQLVVIIFLNLILNHAPWDVVADSLYCEKYHLKKIPLEVAKGTISPNLATVRPYHSNKHSVAREGAKKHGETQLLLITSKNCYKDKEFLNAAKLATSRSCRYFKSMPISITDMYVYILSSLCGTTYRKLRKSDLLVKDSLVVRYNFHVYKVEDTERGFRKARKLRNLVFRRSSTSGYEFSYRVNFHVQENTLEQFNILQVRKRTGEDCKSFRQVYMIQRIDSPLNIFLY